MLLCEKSLTCIIYSCSTFQKPIPLSRSLFPQHKAPCTRGQIKLCGTSSATPCLLPTSQILGHTQVLPLLAVWTYKIAESRNQVTTLIANPLLLINLFHYQKNYHLMQYQDTRPVFTVQTQYRRNPQKHQLCYSCCIPLSLTLQRKELILNKSQVSLF